MKRTRAQLRMMQKPTKRQIAAVVGSQAPLSLMLWGLPGVGKTVSVAQAAAELGIGFKTVIAHLYTPPDVLGLPYIVEGKAHYAPPTAFPDEAIDGPRGCPAGCQRRRWPSPGGTCSASWTARG